MFFSEIKHDPFKHTISQSHKKKQTSQTEMQFKKNSFELQTGI